MKKVVGEKKILGAFLGTIVEYYDYNLYVFSAAIIASKFLPPADYLTNLKYVFGIYAVSYFAKPIGALMFSYIGDRYGRKFVLNITMLGIAIPTVIIGLLPEYSSIGAWSTCILLICRFVQGILVAGEYDGAVIYVIEHLGPKHQAMASSITRATGVMGLLLGVGMVNFFSSHIFPHWGWRIPFLLSFPLSIIALYFRKKLTETPVFVELNNNKKIKNKESYDSNEAINIYSKEGVKKYLLTILMVILLVGGFGVTYQVGIIFIKQYLPIVLPATKFIMTSFSVLLILCFGAFMPISGFFAEKFGEIKIMSIGYVGAMISCIMLIISIKYQIVNLALFSSLALAASISPFNALAHSLIVSSFPANIRYRSVGLGHTVGSMLMSASANYICLSIMEKFKFDLFPVIYIMIFATILFLVITFFFSKISNQSIEIDSVDEKTFI